MISDVASGTSVNEIAKDVYRISTPAPPTLIPGGFSFNQYLILDEQPLLFHTGQRKLFPLVREAIQRIMPLNKLRYVGFSHVEADECGALGLFLELAPQARPLCSRIAAMVSVNDMVDCAPYVMADSETLSLGKHTIRWFDTPHLPHGWESGLLLDEYSGTLFCGDLLTQPGTGGRCFDDDILETSESFRGKMEYYSNVQSAQGQIARLAETGPGTLACMHGSAWTGCGRDLLLELAARLVL